MIEIETTLPTKDLPIRRVISKLFQSYIYSILDDKEHHGYKHPNGKVFKAMNFKINYIENKIYAKYVALNKENEKIVAQNSLLSGLKLGKIHLSSTSVKVKKRDNNINSPIKVGGFVCANIKDGKSNKKIYLQPKMAKFQEIIHNNTIEKYEALFKKKYEGELKIKLIKQKPKSRAFYYSKGVMLAWYGVYEIEASEDILKMILDTGMGANCMKGLGFLEIMREKKGEKNEFGS